MVIDLTREIAFFVLVVACAYTDIARGHVYNSFTFPALAIGAGLAGLSAIDAGSWVPILTYAGGFALGCGPLYLFYRMKQIGGGDVKMMAAVGVLQGYPLILPTMFYSALIGSVMALGTALFTGRLGASLRGAGSALLFRKGAPALVAAEGGELSPQAGVTIPFGFAIAAGGMWAWIQFHLIQH